MVKRICYIEAKNALEKAVQLSHENVYPHYNLAVTLDRLDDYKYAILHYREFLRLVSSNNKGPAIQFSKNRIVELEEYMRK